MDSQTENWITATTELLRLTNEDKLRWTALRPSDNSADDAVGESPIVFTASFEGKHLRLRLTKRKVSSSAYPMITKILMGGKP